MTGPAVLDDERLRDLADRLAGVPGLVAVTLGGSRARGVHGPESDVDLGLYYSGALDTAALAEVARDVAGAHATVTRPGDWGRWVDGGAWLRIDDVAVDWIYRDLDRVEAIWSDVRAGRFAFHRQVGHPLGFADFAYVGELALGHVLVDLDGRAGELREVAQTYPDALRAAVVPSVLWEAHVDVTGAAKAAARGDTTSVAGCLFHAVGLCAHALHAHAGRWLINEKGAVDAAGELPGAPPDFSSRGHGAMARLGRDGVDPDRAVEDVGRLVADTAAACAAPGAG